MKIIKRITINKFRGIDSLQINDFTDINLFIGKNNSGKSTILESIFLLTGISNPALSVIINQIRGIIASPEKLKLLFHNVNLLKSPRIFGVLKNNDSRELIIDPIIEHNIYDQSSDTNYNIEGLDFKFKVNNDNLNQKEHSFKTSIKFVKKQEQNLFGNQQFSPFGLPIAFDITQDGKYKEIYVASFLPTRKDENNTVSRLSQILKKKKDVEVLSLLQSFDKNIKRIQLLPDGIYFEIDEAEELIPLNAMGDGIIHFLNIITFVLERPNSIICIDEMENGLHFSIYSILWKFLFKIAKENNIQLFITTHNIETLSTLATFLKKENNKEFQNMANIYTIANTSKSGYKSYCYSYDSFSNAIEDNIEIRN